MAPGRKESRALFPHLSPPLPPLYIPSLIHFPSLFRSLAFSLHDFIVSQWHSHCLAFLLAVPQTRPPPGLRNTPNTCLPGSDMSSCFPKAVQQTRQLGARLAGGDLRRHNSLLRPLPIVTFDSESLRAGTNKYVNCRTLFPLEVKKADQVIVEDNTLPHCPISPSLIISSSDLPDCGKI